MRRSTFAKLMPPGAALEVSYASNGAYSGNLDAPLGMVWKANYDHTLVISGYRRSELSDDLSYTAKRMAYGIAPCMENNCEICSKAKGEVA